MKRLIFILAAAVMLAGCNVNRNVSGKGIPEHVSHIEFWNGGTNIRTYDNAKIGIRTYLSSSAVGSNISYYFYDVTVDGKIETIVDSEALSIVFQE